MALAQCSDWIRSHIPAARTEAVSSTSQAARLASADPASAAVGSRLAAEIAGIPVLRSAIQDRDGNMTRFAVLGREALERGPGEADRTSVLFALEHRPGALFKAIAPLAEHGVNITRIDSRPRKDRAWEYLFFLDLDGHIKNQPLAKALSEMSRYCSMLKILGSYPREGKP
jgi:chorismate mutase/prephenate dehydratase